MIYMSLFITAVVPPFETESFSVDSAVVDWVLSPVMSSLKTISPASFFLDLLFASFLEGTFLTALLAFWFDWVVYGARAGVGAYGVISISVGMNVDLKLSSTLSTFS